MFGTYSAFYEIKGKYHCFFKGFGPLLKVMEYEDEWCLVLFLLELETQEMLLKGNNTATEHQQRKISTFFSPITHATSQSRATQMGVWPCHNKGVRIDWAIAIWHARKPLPYVLRSHHPCHRHVKAIISRHWKWFLHFGDLQLRLAHFGDLSKVKVSIHLRCNLLFGLTSDFLKNVNIDVFLSFLFLPFSMRPLSVLFLLIGPPYLTLSAPP